MNEGRTATIDELQQQLAQLNTQIDVLGKRANQRLARLRKQVAEGGDTEIAENALIYMRKQAARYNPDSSIVNLGSNMAERFSRKQVKPPNFTRSALTDAIASAQKRIGVLENTLISKSTTKKGQKQIKLNRRRGLSMALYGDPNKLTDREWADIATVFSKFDKKSGYESGTVFEAVKSWKNYGTFKSKDDLFQFLEDTKGKIVSKELEKFEYFAKQGARFEYNPETKKFFALYKDEKKQRVSVTIEIEK